MTPIEGDARNRADADLILLILLVVVLFAAYGSLVPFDFSPLPIDEAAARMVTALSAPLTVASRIDFVSNILLFVPLGFLLTGYLSARGQRGRGNVVHVWLTLIVCLVLSTAIEATQVFFPSRTVASSDIVGETFGALMGAGLWLAMGGRVWRALQAGHHGDAHRSRAFSLLVSCALLYGAGQLLPFDITLQPSELSAKFRSGHIVLMPFSGIRSPATEWATGFAEVLAAAVFGAMLLRATRPQFRGVAVVLGLAYVAAINAAQVLIVSRFADTTDLLLGGAGLLAGAAVARAGLPSEPPQAAGRDSTPPVSPVGPLTEVDRGV
jgi:glycopeptide antibiotics resistance protein